MLPSTYGGGGSFWLAEYTHCINMHNHVRYFMQVVLALESRIDIYLIVRR